MKPSDGTTVSFSDEIPLEPRIDQPGLRITATAAASAPVAMPGEQGDVFTFKVKGDYDVHFKLVSAVSSVRATNASESVNAGDKEVFLLPNRLTYLSVIAPEGDSDVIINCYPRGT